MERLKNYLCLYSSCENLMIVPRIMESRKEIAVSDSCHLLSDSGDSASLSIPYRYIITKWLLLYQGNRRTRSRQKSTSSISIRCPAGTETISGALGSLCLFILSTFPLIPRPLIDPTLKRFPYSGIPIIVETSPEIFLVLFET